MKRGRHGLEKIRTKSLREQTYEQVKRLILSNRLRPNQEIVMYELANELGVSHTPVREALVRLESEGLVDITHHKVPRVAQIDRQAVRELYEVRMILEGWAASRAAITLSDEQLDGLAELLDGSREAAREGRHNVYLAADIKFHRILTGSTGNSLFLRVSTSITDQSVRIRSLVEAISAESIDQIIDEHYAILDALRARNPELAREQTGNHLHAAMHRTLAALETLTRSEPPVAKR